MRQARLDRSSSPGCVPARLRGLVLAAIALGSSAFGSALSAQITWRQRSMEQMYAPATAFDAARGKIVLFGRLPSGEALTAEWDGHDWVPKAPATSPSARSEHAMAYDSLRQRIVLFGGTDGQGSYFDDTWESLNTD